MPSPLVSLGSVVRIRTPLAPETRPRADIKRGLAWTWKIPFLRSTLLLGAGGNIASNSLALILIVIARQHGASTTAVGVLVSIVGAGGLAGSLAAPWIVRHIQPRAILAGLDAIRAPLIVPLAFVGNSYVLGVIGALTIFAAPPWNSLVVGRRIALVPDRLQARVHSADLLVSFSTIPLAFLISGLLLSAVGSKTTVVVYAAWTAALALLALSAPSVRTIPEPHQR